MPFSVLLTNDATRDLIELYDYVAVHDSPRKADSVLEQIEKIFSLEPVSKCSILFEVKKGEHFNHRNIWNISRIKI